MGYYPSVAICIYNPLKWTSVPKNIHWASYSHSCAIVLSHVSRVWSATVKNKRKSDNALHQWLQREASLLFIIIMVMIINIITLIWAKRSFVCVWQRWTIFFLLSIKYLREPDRKSRIIENMKGFFVFLKFWIGSVVLELCLVYNIDIVFLKVSIKCWNSVFTCASLYPEVFWNQFICPFDWTWTFCDLPGRFLFIAGASSSASDGCCTDKSVIPGIQGPGNYSARIRSYLIGLITAAGTRRLQITCPGDVRIMLLVCFKWENTHKRTSERSLIKYCPSYL